MSLEDLKFAIQDTYESLNEKIPFFPVLIGIVFVLIVWLIFFSGGTQQSELTDVLVQVKNNAGAEIRGANVTVKGLENELKLKTDSSGKVSFRAPIGENLEILVSKDDFSGQKKTIVVEKNQTLSVVLQVADFSSREVTLTFVGPDRQKLSGKEVNVKLICTNSDAGEFERSEYTVTGGELIVTPPENCGTINVVASAEGLQTKTLNVLGKEEIIRFEGIEVPKGSAEIIVRDADSNRFVEDLTIKLFKSDGSFTGIQGFTSFGRVTFRGIETGAYNAVITDETGDYGSASIGFTILNTESISKEIRISKDVKLRAKIIAKAKTSGQKIVDATVTLFGEDGTVFEQKKTDANGEAIFSISDDGIYSYIAEKENYFSSQKREFRTSAFAAGSTQNFDAELEACTPSKCGALIVRVVDEDGNPVENASVKLLDESGFIVSAYDARSTDFNGVAPVFAGIANGSYSVLVQKYPAEATSEPLQIDPLGQNKIEVILIVGEGTIFVNAKDNDNEAVEFAEADIYTDYGTLLGTVSLNADGFGNLPGVKADKKVYAVVRKDGYSSYFTVAKQVVKAESIFFNAILERSILGEKPKIELDGVYTKQGRLVNSLTQGQRFDAKFILTIPSDTSFSETGAFIRAGDFDSLEKDNIWIQEINAPNTSSTSGITFQPPDGTPELTNGNAKWVSLQWNDPEPGRYEFETEIKVEEGTSPGTFLPVFYRAGGIDNGKYLRDPLDAELGEGFETNSKKELYAESYQKAFFEGISELCFGEFCTSERVLDLDEDIIINQPYNVKTFSPYEIEFTITNNSKKLLDDAFIEIKSSINGVNTNEDIQISSYVITNADSQEFISNGSVFETERIFLGDFRQNKTIRGILTIQPKTENPGALYFRIVSDQQLAFEKFMFFTPFALNELDLKAGPETLPAFVNFDLNVVALHASGREEGFGIEDAKVIVTRVSPDRSETIFIATTNANGEANIGIPASSPGTRLLIRAEKPGIGFKELEKKISDEVVSFNPTKLGFSLKRETQETDQKDLVIGNLIQTPLFIKKIVTSGRFKGLLDEDRMDAFLGNYLGLDIGKGEEETLQVLSAIGSEAEFLDEPVTAKGKLIFEFGTNANPNATWVSEVEFDSTINLADLPENQNCLVLSNNVWKDSTLQGKSSIEFELQNNCTANDGGLIGLDNLQATIDWTGSDGIIGLVEITVVNPDTGEAASEILQPGLWSKLFEGIEPGQFYVVRLEFVSKPGTVGKTGKFDVTIDGQVHTNSGFEFIGSNNNINSEILIVNLDQCIKSTTGFGGEGILELGGDDLGTFTIDTSACGTLPLNFRLCNNDSGCRNGTSEGGINVRPLTFSLNENKTTQEVTVQRESIPGVYGVSIEVQPQGGSWRKVGEVLVSLDPIGASSSYNNPFSGGFGAYTPGLFASGGSSVTHSGEPFVLSKYDFAIKGIGATDTATLTNRFLSESVPVNASACDWGTAEELEAESPFNFATAGLGAAGGGLLGAKPAFAAAQSAAKQAGKEAGKAISEGTKQSKEAVGEVGDLQGEVENLQTAQEALDAQSKATEGTIQAVDTGVNGTVVSQANAVQAACGTCAAGPAGTTAAATLTGTKTAMTAAKESVDSIGDQVGKIAGQTQTLSENTADADGLVNQGATTARPPDTGKTACEEAQPEFGDALSQSQGASELSGKVTSNLGDVSSAAEEAASKTSSELGGKLALTQTKVEAVITAIEVCVPVTIPQFATCGPAKAEATIAIHGVLNTQIADATQSIKDLADSATELGKASSTAGKAGNVATENLDKLSGGIENIQSSCSDFTSQATATGDAANFRWGRFGGMMGTYMGLGFLGGGLIGNLFGGEDEDPCDSRETQNTQDWVINLAPGINPQIQGLGRNVLQQIFSGGFNAQTLLRSVSLGANVGDALPVQTDNDSLDAEWNFKDARSLGQFDQQQVGVIFENTGLPEDEETVYSIVSFRALKHVHAKPTIIKRGQRFGQFNVPDLLVEPINQKFHLRFETGEEKTQLTEINFDAVSCSVGTQIGYTGAEVKPLVLLNWGWDKFSDNKCDQGNDDYVYCDATQFSMETTYKLETLRKFLEINKSVLTCPTNPAETILDELTSELSAFGLLAAIAPQTECWMPMSTIEIEGRPALDFYVEDHLNEIQWLPEDGINNREDLLNLLTFNAYLLQDGYSTDFKQDFSEFYNNQRFFNTPDFFTRLGTDGSGGTYGLDKYFETDSIRFNKKYLEDRDAQLSSPGLYRVHIRGDFEKDWEFFNSNGEPSAYFNIELGLLNTPEVDSPFYRLPFDGLVGLQGDTLERQGYGLSYKNESEEFVTVSNELAPAKTFETSGSNAFTNANVQVERNLFKLNTSPQTRGKILEVQKLTGRDATIVFQPTQATPVMMKITKKDKTEEPFSAFYQVLENDVPVDTGNTLAYWSGAGTCLDFTGVPVTEQFFEKPDRAATQEDSLTDFQSIYGLDWQNAVKTGDVYLRTIIYADPLSDTVIRTIKSDAETEFITADERGSRVALHGVAGMPHNNFAGGTEGTINTIADLFDLIDDGEICITSTGNSTSFWWNPQTVYSTKGTQRNISELTNSLEAGNTCIS